MCDSPLSTASTASIVSYSASSSTSDSSLESEAAQFGTGPYHNVRRGIELRSISDDFQGLFAMEPLAKGTVLWHNRADGPAEVRYRKIYGEHIEDLSPEQLRFFIRYSYQQNDDLFISPLCAEEVDADFSNYFNHSCEPNTLPLGEDNWVAVRDIAEGEQLTIDYCTFDSNQWICIEHCLCGTRSCRRFVRADDYRIVELQQRYRGHFLPYIQEKIDEEALAAKNGRVIGGAGGPRNDFSAAAVRAFHEAHPVDIEAHNRKATAALIARFANNGAATGLRALSCKENAENCSVVDPKAVRAPETIAV